MSLIRAAVRISSLCHLCKDWCLCAYKITYYFVHGLCLVLRMTWQTLCPTYRFRDFDVSLQHTGRYSNSPTRPLADVVTYLLGSSLHPSSLPTYTRAYGGYTIPLQ